MSIGLQQFLPYRELPELHFLLQLDQLKIFETLDFLIIQVSSRGKQSQLDCEQSYRIE
jgi:hypothetical protein